jgi:hypothetical protein
MCCRVQTKTRFQAAMSHPVVESKDKDRRNVLMAVSMSPYWVRVRLR